MRIPPYNSDVFVCDKYASRLMLGINTALHNKILAGSYSASISL